MRKIIICLVMTFVLLAGVMTLVYGTDSATSGTCGDNLTWVFDVDTETLTVSGTGAMTNYKRKSEVPWSAWTYTYTDSEPSIKHIVIENGVTTIGKYAFDGCSQALDVQLPGGLTSIGNYSFYGCDEITEISIPTTVEVIGTDAFYSCDGLTEINIAEGN